MDIERKLQTKAGTKQRERERRRGGQADKWNKANHKDDAFKPKEREEDNKSESDGRPQRFPMFYYKHQPQEHEPQASIFELVT